MTRVLYILPGVPSILDPLGASPDADPTPTPVEAVVKSKEPDGTYTIKLLDSRCGDTTISGVVEGFNVRQAYLPSGAGVSQKTILLSNINTLISNGGNATLINLARLVKAILTDVNTATLVDRLSNIAFNSSETVNARAFALLGLSIVCSGDR